MHGISFRPTCFGARSRTPGRVPVQQVGLKSERFGMAYRLSLTYAFVCLRSSEIAHTTGGSWSYGHLPSLMDRPEAKQKGAQGRRWQGASETRTDGLRSHSMQHAGSAPVGWQVSDQSATVEERQERKRRLLKGPGERGAATGAIQGVLKKTKNAPAGFPECRGHNVSLSNKEC